MEQPLSPWMITATPDLIQMPGRPGLLCLDTRTVRLYPKGGPNRLPVRPKHPTELQNLTVLGGVVFADLKQKRHVILTVSLGHLGQVLRREVIVEIHS